jgi:hypothetical protein
MKNALLEQLSDLTDMLKQTTTNISQTVMEQNEVSGLL